MKKILKEVLDFIIKNKYIITLVVIVLFLHAIGFLKVLAEIVALVLLVAIAIFFGKKIQDAKFKTKGEFKNKENVYYSYEKDDKDN